MAYDSYDREGRAVSARGSLGSGTYTVDGNGLRVQKVSGGTTTVYIFSGRVAEPSGEWRILHVQTDNSAPR